MLREYANGGTVSQRRQPGRANHAGLRPCRLVGPYAPGTLLVKGYDANQNVIASNQVVTTGLPAAVNLTTDRTTLTADGEDVTVVYASIVDAQGLVVPTASNLVAFATQGPGYVAGVGNGDPASHEPDRASQRHAFNGWCMALIGATNTGGAVVLTASAPGLASATLDLQSNPTNSPPATPAGLAASAGNLQATLNWGLSFGATSYNVKRAGVSGGPYSTVASDYGHRLRRHWIEQWHELLLCRVSAERIWRKHQLWRGERHTGCAGRSRRSRRIGGRAR